MKIKPVQLGLAVAVAGLAIQSATAFAAAGDWILRAGVGVVDPKSDNLDGAEGSTIEVDDGTSATVEVVYMFADRWGVELLAAWPFNHDVVLESGGSEEVIGEVEHMPPTLSLQYHFNPDGKFRPYVGAGLNYTTFSGEETAGPLAGSSLSLDDSWGLAAQIGADYGLSENWFINAALRWIDIDSDAELDGATLGEVEIDPLVYQLQVGYRFGRPAPVAAAVPVAAAAAPPPPPPADSDGDGVTDDKDQCPDTPKGDRVGPQGCTCDVTRQLQFEFNSADLTAEDKKILDEVAETLLRLKFISGTVIGHTDSTGPEEFNQRLSERRAATVAQYLEAKGVAPGRLAVSGMGESQPIADNATREGRALNRRVVLRRTDCDQP
jgi:outer membrane protein